MSTTSVTTTVSHVVTVTKPKSYSTTMSSVPVKPVVASSMPVAPVVASSGKPWYPVTSGSAVSPVYGTAKASGTGSVYPTKATTASPVTFTGGANLNSVGVAALAGVAAVVALF
jgi:hypothetical protein